MAEPFRFDRQPSAAATTRNRLPPLNALRSFEAAARHGSFVRASEELFITPSAVSHQIRKLEDQLGIRLFERGARDVVLSERGRDYLLFVQEAFDRLSTGTDILTGQAARTVLRVSSDPAFAFQWLMPRLGSFMQACADVEVQIIAANPGMTGTAAESDVAIVLGDPGASGVDVVPLFTDVLAPIAAPMVGSVYGFPAEDLASIPVITEVKPDVERTRPGKAGSGSFPSSDWLRWIVEANIGDVKPARVLSFETKHAATEAAIHGLGIAMGPLRILEEHLLDGRLVMPWNLVIEASSPYVAVCTPGRRSDYVTGAFLEWLSAEAASVRARPLHEQRPHLVSGRPEGSADRDWPSASLLNAPMCARDRLCCA